MNRTGRRATRARRGQPFDRRPRVLFISPDAVGRRMAGLGIRYTELARALADSADVRVATGAASHDPEPGRIPGTDVQVVEYEPHAPSALRAQIGWADAIVAPPQWPVVTRWLRRSGKRIIFDLYDPETLESIELFRARRPALRKLMVALTLDRLADALRTGHHFMCASEGQRDLWLGAMLSAGVIPPKRYDEDPSLSQAIDLVPFGLPGDPPLEGAGPREAFGVLLAPDDEIVLWNGGIWPWLDAPIAVEAVTLLSRRRPQVRLVFMGKGSGFAGQAAFEQTRAAAAEMGVLGSTVLFPDTWVPYDERGGWLLQADCAIATASDHLETRFSFRTRLLDCFWAGLPIVCTSGDDLAARVQSDGLGGTAPPGDAIGLALELERALELGRGAHQDAFASARRAYAWSTVAEPLRNWIVPGAPLPRRAPRGVRPRPAQIARTAAYGAVRAGLRVTGRRWPAL